MPGSGPKRLRLRVPRDLEGFGTRIGPSRWAEKGAEAQVGTLSALEKTVGLMGDDGGMGEPSVSKRVNLGAKVPTFLLQKVNMTL